MKGLTALADFLYEVGILNNTPRSGLQFLGNVKQSVAEHSHWVAYIGLVLASMEKNIDCAKLIKMCLTHDIAEGRTGDLNLINKKYCDVDESKVMEDITANLPFGGELISLFKEYEEKNSLEAKLAKDADQLELILLLKEQIDLGNKKAEAWLHSATKRLKTTAGRKLMRAILKRHSDAWWIGDPKDNWWVNPIKETQT